MGSSLYAHWTHDEPMINYKIVDLLSFLILNLFLILKEEKLSCVFSGLSEWQEVSHGSIWAQLRCKHYHLMILGIISCRQSVLGFPVIHGCFLSYAMQPFSGFHDCDRRRRWILFMDGEWTSYYPVMFAPQICLLWLRVCSWIIDCSLLGF